jgi:hypothetical protein
MSDLSQFESFQKLYRLKRGCIITEKIDGTNAQVCIDDSGVMRVGSRNRWITPDDDNFGFARWCRENRDELAKLGPGRHFGEWWGPGIQRGYGLKEKRFSLFNTSRWGGERSVERPRCCDVVPVLYAGDFSTDVVADQLAQLDKFGSQASPGFMRPEGVVVFLPAAGTSYKVTLGGDGHKGSKEAA